MPSTVSFRRILFPIAACVVAFCMFVWGIDTVSAASPLGRHGWMVPISEVVGDDASCAAGEFNLEIELREYGTNNLISSVGSALFVVGDKVTNAVKREAEGPGPYVGPLCVNAYTDFTGVDVDGGSGYYDYWSSNNWNNPEALPPGKLMRQTVWLVPTPTSNQYVQVSPVNTVTRVNPDYQFNLNVLPTNYGASQIRGAQMYVVRYNPITGSLGSIAHTQTHLLSGGVGLKVMPPASALGDGIYTWGAYISLNGTNSMNLDIGVLESLYVLKTGLMWFNWPFMLDTTPPTFSLSTGHIPTSPRSSETVTITGSVSDALAGINSIRVYVDGSLVKTCPFASVNSADCVASSGPHANGTVHPYFIVATDAAGNTATSSTMQFTVTNPDLPDLATYELLILTPTVKIIKNADGTQSTESTYSISEECVISGWLYDSDCGGGSTVQNTPQTDDRFAFSNMVHKSLAYVRTVGSRLAKAILGKLAFATSGSIITVPGNIAQGKELHLYTKIWNLGTAAASTNFNNEFQYQFDSTSEAGWIAIPPTNTKAALPPTGRAVDQAKFVVPLRGGTLYIRHCLDVDDAVEELDEDNCTVTNGINLGPGNAAPDMSAGIDQTITFPTSNSAPSGARATDADGSVASTVWSFVSGPSTPTITGETTLTPTFTNLSTVGTYVFLLSVTDNLGLIVTDEMHVEVVSPVAPDLSAANTGPAANAAFLTTDSITFTGTANNSNAAAIPEGGWADVEIDWGSDDSFDNLNAFGEEKLGAFATNESKTLTRTWNNPPQGTHRYRFNVDTLNELPETNNDNNRSAWVVFTVTPPLVNQLPDVNAGTENVIISFPITTASPSGVTVSDPDGTVDSVEWTFETGPSGATILGADSNTPTFTNLDTVGDYTFKLTATDDVGGQNSDTMTVTVTPAPPWATISANPTVVSAGGTSQITWNSEQYSVCSVAGLSGSDSWSGPWGTETTSPINADTTYAVTCDGSPRDSVLIRVSPDVTLTANKYIVRPNEEVEISWNTNGNNEALCTLTQNGLPTTGFLDGDGVGSKTVTLNSRTRFTLSCGAQPSHIDIEMRPTVWNS